MNQLDEHGNHIATTIFETYLSLFLIKNERFYREVFTKINHAIKLYIDNNSKDPGFDRMLFGIFSNISKQFPEYQRFEDILHKFNLEAHIEFHKQFFEAIFNKNKLLELPKQKPNQLYSLSELCQFSLARKCGGKKKDQLRPLKLFAPKDRSRKEVSTNFSNHPFTNKFGIASTKHTPHELSAYFKEKFQPAQNQFSRNPEGGFSKWLEARNLPFISGPSGTIEILFNNLNLLMTFTTQELKCYFMALAAATVARGHHSFAEVWIVAKMLGFRLDETQSRQTFYEQFLTSEVLNSSEYKDFLFLHMVREYFKEYDATFQSTQSSPCSRS